ncbi:MAG: hypothetical protein R3C46_08655 [Hyphomonadaceae bacterium]
MAIFAALMAAAMLFAVWRMYRGRYGVIEKKKPDPDFDPAEGQPEAREAATLLQQHQWRELTRLYGRLSPSDRYHLIESAAALIPSAPLETPEDADSILLTILGGVRLFQGMTPVGSGPTVSVLKANAARMMESLREAARLLKEAAARNMHDSTNLALQICLESVATGDQAHINSLVGRVQASDEDNIYAAANHLLANSPMRRGTPDAMWRVANEWANSGPNAAWLAIPAKAHIEEWRYAMTCCPPGSPERSAMIDRMQDDEFIRHIAKLDDMFWAAFARTPLSGAEASFAHNHFAFLLHLFKVENRAKEHLDRIGPYIARHPWSLLPTGASRPTQLLADLRRTYGLQPLS